MNTYEQLAELCNGKLKELNLHEDKRYIKRLKWELDEVGAKEKADYFWNLYSSKIRYPKNQNNLLICKLLGIVKDFSIEEEPKCEYGEYPDIDVDYMGVVRDYLKNDWAPRNFGEQFVCNIGSYTTFGLKNSLIDMARVHGESRDEIQATTKNLEAKDDEGKVLTWDAAMKLYPALKKYCEEHPDVANAAKKLLNRNRGMGQHAGGLIIASTPLNDLVPLVKRKDNPQASSWVEGLHGQDLQPVGLVKFDLLVISNLVQIAYACELIKKRHNLEGICNLPGQPDWTDVPRWRNDPKALAMADKGDLKCIFQFDSDGIRNLVREGGVDRFEDLVAYTALYRPGPLGMKMQERYVERKRGREKFDLHPLVKPILEKTYGVLTYQEQIMKILNVVGEIPLKDCEIVRKAISKKKVEGFIEYKEKFIKRGQVNLGISEQEINHLWDQIEAFAEYGFNLSHAVAYTYISSRLLWLKAHYPHEFYTAILSCENLSEKIKEYKIEAKFHNVEMNRLDINKSKETFTLVDDMIYYGFSNVKGIGEEAAKRIVAGQPYVNFEDFLNRFGTDAKVLKPLIGLRCFKDADPITLYKFLEFFREKQKKILGSKKRNVDNLERYQEQFEKLTGCSDLLIDFQEGDPFDSEEWRLKLNHEEDILVDKEVECKEDESTTSRWVTTVTEIEGTDDVIERDELKYYKTIKVSKKYNRWKELKKLWGRFKSAVRKNGNKESLPTLAEFDSNSWDIDDEVIVELRQPNLCESIHIGFQWESDLERSPDFKGGMNFDQFRADPSLTSAPVEVQIRSIKKSESKKTKGFFYWNLQVEDVTGEVASINIWADDWERFSSDLLVGNLVRMKVKPPSGGFKTYTFDSPPKHLRWKFVPKSKDEDFRCVTLRRGTVKIDNYLTHEEALNQFGDCTQ